MGSCLASHSLPSEAVPHLTTILKPPAQAHPPHCSSFDKNIQAPGKALHVNTLTSSPRHTLCLSFHLPLLLDFVPSVISWHTHR
ncbi:hypothetical protein P7K49_028384 [Saguinus oedipus]|uniref:Uncharacterized protein n=1 Tax=Saguinus oedipus TaxID=9490 RepID=A0ABQ9UC66_SAGOE|nr:hypothetical protein P7K49_028384 [Saguinus oedipus]